MNLVKERDYWEETFESCSRGEVRYIHGGDFYDNNKELNGLVLDDGCGDLESALKLKQSKNSYLVGLDFSRNGLKIAKSNIRNRRSDNVDVVLAAAEYLPFKDNVFDKVLCIETIKHVCDYRKALEEAKRVSKSDLVLTFELKDQWFAFSGLCRANIRIEDNILTMEKNGIKIETNSFNEKIVKKLVEKLGLKVEKRRLYETDVSDIPPVKKSFTFPIPPTKARSAIYLECKKK